MLVYKITKLILKATDGDKEQVYHAFIAGCIGGYTVFRKDNQVNNQIVMYLFSRVVVGLIKLAYQKLITRCAECGPIQRASKHGFEIQATIVWGLVMWLFSSHKTILQPSLQASMQYLYNDSEHWDSLRTLLLHNK